MKYQFFVLKKENYDELNKLTNRVKLDEQLDKDAIFIVGIEENDLQGAVGFSFRNDFLDKENIKLPRLEHIIVDNKYQKTRLGVLLLKEMEKYLKEREYKEYYSYILNTNERMKKYAIKWGMKLKNIGRVGSCYYKPLENVDDKAMAVSK